MGLWSYRRDDVPPTVGRMFFQLLEGVPPYEANEPDELEQTSPAEPLEKQGPYGTGNHRPVRLLKWNRSNPGKMA